MRKEPLSGYVVHSRPYRETSRIVHFFSLEHGRVDGVCRGKVPASYQLFQVFASGNQSLKTFTGFEEQTAAHILQADALIAGFYLNELLLRLLPVEEAMPQLWLSYQHTVRELSRLQAKGALANLKSLLRLFEYVLITELGYGLDFRTDHLGAPIEIKCTYTFDPDEGFHRGNHGFLGQTILRAAELLTAGQSGLPMSEYWQDPAIQQFLSRVFRLQIHRLLDGQPIRSRALWLTRSQ